MAGAAGQNHPYDGGGGGGGGGPDGPGGAAGSGDYNGVNGGDGSDLVPVGATAGGPGSYGSGYVSVSYEDTYGLMFDGGSITIEKGSYDEITGRYIPGRITHVFFNPGIYELVGVN